MTKICPKCGSTNLSFKQLVEDFGMYCRDCGHGQGHLGTIFPDVDDVETFRKGLE